MVIIHFTWLASQSFAKGVAGRLGAAARNSRNCRGETQADYNYIVMQITDIVWGGWSECVGACWISPSTSPSGLFFPLFSLPLAWQETREQENHLWFDILKPEDNYHDIQFLLVFAHVGHEWVSIQNVQIQHNEPPQWLCSIAKHLQFTFPWGLSVLKMYFHIWHQPDLVYPIMKPNVLHQEGQRCWWVGHYKCLRFGCTSCITEGFILTLCLWMFSFCPSIFVSIV